MLLNIGHCDNLFFHLSVLSVVLLTFPHGGPKKLIIKVFLYTELLYLGTNIFGTGM
jgi:hypothetical protein